MKDLKANIEYSLTKICDLREVGGKTLTQRVKALEENFKTGYLPLDYEGLTKVFPYAELNPDGIIRVRTDKGLFKFPAVSLLTVWENLKRRNKRVNFDKRALSLQKKAKEYILEGLSPQQAYKQVLR